MSILYIFRDFLIIGLSNFYTRYAADCWFDREDLYAHISVLLLIADLALIAEISDCVPVTATPSADLSTWSEPLADILSFYQRTYKPLMQVHADNHHILDF